LLGWLIESVSRGEYVMAGDFVLAIDQGTTSSRAIVFNHDSATVGEAQQEFTQHYPRPGWVEHDANEIWDVTLGVMRQAIEDAGISPGDIAAIGITNQRETVALWDRETGEPVHNAIVWQDRRGAAFCNRLIEQGYSDTVRDKAGLTIDAYFSGSKVTWLLENIDGLKERAQNGEIAFGTMDTWLIWKLTGGRAHVTDYSNASRTLMYNIFDLKWDDDLLEMLGGVPREMLPEVKPSSIVYGDTDAEVFGAEVPVAGVAGDQQAALFGEVAFDPGLTKNTYGTGSFALMNTGTEPIKSERQMLTTIAWGLGDKPVEYALEGAIFITGAAVQWLRDGLGIIQSAEETEELAASLDSNDDVYFVPGLVGLGAPHWDSYARGTIVGLTRGTTRAHLARAALESMCYQTRDAVEAMEADSGTDIPTFKADGGAAANRWMMQFQADILGTPVEVPETLETTALGAAYLAGLAVGFWEDQEELKSRWRLRRRYEPQMSEEERERLYGRWKEAVSRSKEWAQEAVESPLA
jgi:glycerol kinase